MDGAVTVEDDAMNKQLESKVTITASYLDHMPTDYERCIAEYGEDSIQCSILAQVDTTGACPTVNDDGTVTVNSAESTNAYLCSAPDDYGTSYYFRGTPKNNYVKFAGFYWRILRINGDGSIRMIYAGDADVIDSLENKAEVLANGYDDGSTDYTQIGTDEYNSNEYNSYYDSSSISYDSNAGVGYMYGENIWGEPVTSETTSIETLNSYYYYYADNYTFDTATGTYTLANPTQAVWNESLVGKYTCRDNEDTSCTTLYYIDSYRNADSGYTRLYTRTSTDTGYEESHGTSTSRQTFANYNYYGTGYTFNKSTGEFELPESIRSIYDGSQVGTYTCANTNSSCRELYYIESTNDTTTANVKTISRTGANTYDETHANINNSSIKTRVDTWYEENIANHPEYTQYISDTLFCNDRSFASNNSGTGAGTSTTYYRWYYSSSNGIRLTCTQQNDRFTVDDEMVGNGDLTYPVGLLTTDEAYLAGGKSSNSRYYLYTGNYYWTMSPGYFNGSLARVRAVNSGGALSTPQVDSLAGVRPVLNLKPNSLTFGDGSASNPFLVG